MILLAKHLVIIKYTLETVFWQKINQYFGFDKYNMLVRIVRWNGGLKKSVQKLYLMDDLRFGCFVGKDKFGNKYYKNPNYFFFPRDRWVEYPRHVKLEYDASQVCPEWFGWLHHKTDRLPENEMSRPKYKWMLDHEENQTGTSCQYVPYSTTKPKILPWIPPKVKISESKQC